MGQSLPALCHDCGGSYVLDKQQETICHAPDASDEGKRSSGIGEVPLSGLSVSADLTLLHQNSEKHLKVASNMLIKIQSLHDQVFMQNNQISDLQETVKFLAQQVKTLVDALAEDADPDAPLTTYMDGRPI